MLEKTLIIKCKIFLVKYGSVFHLLILLSNKVFQSDLKTKLLVENFFKLNCTFFKWFLITNYKLKQNYMCSK